MLLPVYNGAKHLSLAINSVLQQSYLNLELIIVDDASTDESWNIICAFSDSRLITVRNRQNVGLSGALNIAANIASGKYLARHDQDDVSHRHRIHRQVQFLSSNPNIVAVGTWVQLRRYLESTFQDHVPRRQHPTTDHNIRLLLSWNNPFVHGSMMMRKTAFEKCGGYSQNSDVTPPEDYELWTRMGALGEFANLPMRLLTYQINPTGMSQTRSKEIFAKSIAISQRFINDVLCGKHRSYYYASLTILNGKPDSDLRFADYLRADRLIFALARAIAKQRGPFPLSQLVRAVRTIHEVQLGQSVSKHPWLQKMAWYILRVEKNQ